MVYAIVRVPKSGSTTLVHIMKAALPDAQVFQLPHDKIGKWNTSPIQGLRFLRSQKKALFGRYRSFSLDKVMARIETNARCGDLIAGGHVTLATFKRLKLETRVVTLLRDPVSRFLSQYNYARRNYQRKPLYRRFDSSFLERRAGTLSIDDFAAAMEEHAEVLGNHASGMLGINDPHVIPEILQRELFHFGVLEAMPAFLEGLQHKLGRRIEGVHRNATGERAATELSAETRARIERLNALDCELYEVARQLGG